MTNAATKTLARLAQEKTSLSKRIASAQAQIRIIEAQEEALKPLALAEKPSKPAKKAN